MSNHAAASQQVATLEQVVNPFYDNDDRFDVPEVREVDLSTMRRISPGIWMSDLKKKYVKPDGEV
jgi:hypothetical protein